MVNCEASVDYIMDSGVCIGIVIDLTKSVEKAIVLFDILLEEKVKSIYFIDTNTRNHIEINKGDSDVRLDSKVIITLSQNDIEIIRNMMLDVSIGLGFAGYHYDIEASDACPIDLCFTFNKCNSQMAD